MMGHFASGKNYIDGQTIKTRMLYNCLLEREVRIVSVDTSKKKNNPIALIIDSILAFIKCDTFIILLSGNGMKVYFPVLYLLSRYLGKRIYHDVIGGNLDEYIKSNKQFKKYLNSFSKNWVEIESLRYKLDKLGIKNAEVIPNFKNLRIASGLDKNRNQKPYAFCTFSRVVKEKGIEDAINAVKLINNKWNKDICKLDIYGEINADYVERFKELLRGAGNNIKYCGVIDYEETTNVLEKYFALLFPTYWHGEGLPGTIIDAFAAGLPVIATDWNYNDEIITSGKTGIIYKREDGLYSVLMDVIDKPEMINSMRGNCVNEARRYLPDLYVDKMIQEIRLGAK